MKHTIVDLKKTQNIVSSPSDFLRIKAGTDDNLYKILSNGDIKDILQTFLYPIESFLSDPSTITPTENIRFIVDTGINGFAGQDNNIAQYINSQWVFISPDNGSLIYNKDDLSFYFFNGSEWIDINDTNVTTKADERTITLIDDFAETSTLSDISSIFEPWDFYPSPSPSPGYSVKMTDGIIYIPPRINTVATVSSASGNLLQMSAGDEYYFYSNKDLSPYQPYLRGDFNTNQNEKHYFSMIENQNGLYVHKVTIPSNFECGGLWFEDNTHPGIFISLIKKGSYPTTGKNTVSIFGIDKIINKEGFSINNFFEKSTMPDSELPTVSYVNRTKNNADDITTELIQDTNIYYAQDNDLTTVCESAWHAGIPSTNYSYHGSPSISNGIIIFNNTNDAITNFIHCNDLATIPDIQQTRNLYIISNIQWSTISGAGGPAIAVGSTGTLRYTEEIYIDGIEWLYRFVIPKGHFYRPSGVELHWYTYSDLPQQPYLKLVDSDLYPTNNIIKIKNINRIIDSSGVSIDASATPAFEPDKEMITRGYVDNKITTTATNVDDITIENEDGIRAKSTTHNINYEIRNNWVENYPSNNNFTDAYYDSNNSCFYVTLGTTNIIYNTSSEPSLVACENGKILYLLSSIELTEIPVLYDSYSGVTISGGQYEQNNGEYYLLRYNINNSTFKITNIMFPTGCKEPAKIWFVNTFAPYVSTQVKIKQIRRIIGADNRSIDGSFVESEYPKVELPTLDYVNKRMNVADDITLEKEQTLPICCDDADYNTLMKSAFASDQTTIPTTNWVLGSNTTYLNGLLTINTQANSTEDILRNSSLWRVEPYETTLMFITDTQLNTSEYQVYLKAGAISYNSYAYYEKLLSNGWYQYTIILPKFLQLYSFSIENLTSTNKIINIRLIKWDDYPAKEIYKIKNINYIIDDDNESIDGSDTPATDPHSELVTRAYIDVLTDGLANVDDITIEKTTGYSKTATESTIGEVILNNWCNNVSLTGWTGGLVYNGVFQCTPRQDTVFDDDAGNNVVWNAGIYEFYSNVDLTPYNICLWDLTNDNPIYFTVIKEHGLYRHTTTLSSSTVISGLYTDSSPLFPYSIAIINRYDTSINSELTVKNVNWIIDSDELSIDNYTAPSSDPHTELPTLDYVNKKIPDSDNITIEATQNTPDIINNNNYQTVLYDAWDDHFATNNWTLGGNCTYSNGVFSINYNSSSLGSGQMLTHPGNTCTKGIYKFISNEDFDTNGLQLVVIDNTNDVLTSSYNQELLSNGEYLYTIYIPYGLIINEIAIIGGSGGLGGGYNGIIDIKIVDMLTYPKQKLFKIKNINYIIDDDNESIDGSNTSAIDPHSELVTRAFVENNIQSNTHWTKVNTMLEPTDSLVDTIKVSKNYNGYNTFVLENTNTGNGAGAVFEAKKTTSLYQDNMYMGIYSDNFWLPQLAGKGVLMTDQDLVLGTVDTNASINFLVGDSYTNPTVVGHLNQNGFYLDALQTTSVHPASYYNLFVDASTGLIYASNTGATGNTPQIDTFTITNTDITNGYLQLSQNISQDNHEFVNLNGLILMNNIDYTVNYTNYRIEFTASQITELTVGDVVQIKYKY